jgi:hypothetical protein
MAISKLRKLKLWFAASFRFQNNLILLTPNGHLNQNFNFLALNVRDFFIILALPSNNFENFNYFKLSLLEHI